MEVSRYLLFFPPSLFMLRQAISLFYFYSGVYSTHKQGELFLYSRLMYRMIVNLFLLVYVLFLMSLLSCSALLVGEVLNNSAHLWALKVGMTYQWFFFFCTKRIWWAKMKRCKDINVQLFTSMSLLQLFIALKQRMTHEHEKNRRFNVSIWKPLFLHLMVW